jgi:hypothetical protein
MEGGKRTLLTFCAARLECDERPEPCEDRASSLVKVMVDGCEGGYTVSSESREWAELAGGDAPYGLCCISRDQEGGGGVGGIEAHGHAQPTQGSRFAMLSVTHPPPPKITVTVTNSQALVMRASRGTSTCVQLRGGARAATLQTWS